MMANDHDGSAMLVEIESDPTARGRRLPHRAARCYHPLHDLRAKFQITVASRRSLSEATNDRLDLSRAALKRLSTHVRTGGFQNTDARNRVARDLAGAYRAAMREASDHGSQADPDELRRHAREMLDLAVSVMPPEERTSGVGLEIFAGLTRNTLDEIRGEDTQMLSDPITLSKSGYAKAEEGIEVVDRRNSICRTRHLRKPLSHVIGCYEQRRSALDDALGSYMLNPTPETLKTVSARLDDASITIDCTIQRVTRAERRYTGAQTTGFLSRIAIRNKELVLNLLGVSPRANLVTVAGKLRDQRAKMLTLREQVLRQQLRDASAAAARPDDSKMTRLEAL